MVFTPSERAFSSFDPESAPTTTSIQPATQLRDPQHTHLPILFRNHPKEVSFRNNLDVIAARK
jgi:hypothetical protein